MKKSLLLLVICSPLLLSSCSMTVCNDFDDMCGWVEEVQIGYNLYFSDDVIKVEMK